MGPAESGGYAVFIDAEQLLLAPLRRRGVQGAELKTLASELPPEARVSLLGQQLPARIGRLQVVVSNRLLRFTSLPWSDSLAARESREAYLAGRWRQVFGEADGAWSLALEPGSYEQASVLMALPRELGKCLQQLATERGVETLTVQPLIAAAWATCRSQCPRDCLFATLEPGCLTVAVVRAGAIEKISSHRVSGEWVEAVSTVRRRLLLRDASLEALGPLRLLRLSPEKSAATPEASAINLLVPPAPVLPAALLSLAARAGRGLGFALLPRRLLTRADQRLLIAAALVFLIALGLRLLPAVPAPSSADAGAARPEPAPTAPLDSKAKQKLVREVAAANRAVRELNLPADAVLAALSPRRVHDVALLGIDITSASEGKVRVTAAARSLEGMAAYLQALEQRPDLRGVVLIHHEAGEDANWPYRFAVEAVWQHP